MTELYKKAPQEARENGEIEQYRESMKENKRCAEFIEKITRERYDARYFPSSCFEDTVSEFGAERTGWVIANTINLRKYDGRISSENHNWAAGLEIPVKQQESGFGVNIHSCLLNDMADDIRRISQELAENQAEKYRNENTYNEKIKLSCKSIAVNSYRIGNALIILIKNENIDTI